ncbi:translin [Histoplasma capsulatum G186AR]|uniref:Translin n=1 Tax=Ajellomyces capsulatus (strain G186AR / H82 / ATCC MYA-2454 / RMSCC 2432) TaxID=447093 RepID=C0NI24_AJECG|nr:translin [Histoplasma capsulatum G186AR]EEH09459.1 translin [Histoplasma capsulatum G186AR]
MIDPSIFQSLQAKIDEESQIRDELQDIVQTLSKRVTPVLDEAATEIRAQKEDVARLVSVAAQHPFYKYNHIWSRELQNLVFTIQFCAWLGGLRDARAEKAKGFMTIEEVGEFLGVPVNLKDQDSFHLSIEEYLQALISLVEELSRLAVNSVTLGDYARPLQISKFVSDLQAGFQLLNLKNDSLRKRSDGIKYSVKKVEDVVYDLSLRNLIPRNPPAGSGGGGGDMEE